MEYKTIEELKEKASKYEYEKSENLVQIFLDNHVYFPDFIHRFILLNLIKKYIFNSDLYNTFTDEYKYKLRSYNYFSIYILEKAITDYNLEIPAHEYKNLFMRFYLKNEKKFKNSVALSKALEMINAKKPKKEESIKVCLNEFAQIYYTPKGYLDGLSLSILKEAITASYNINEMKGLAAKYEIDLPRRINKNQLIDLLVARFHLSNEEKAVIENKPISEICTYAKDKGFRISSDLKKQDMVEYIIFSLNKYHEEVEKDLYNYDIILDSEKEQSENAEQDDVIETDQGLPTSSILVDAPTDIEVKEVNRDYAIEDTQVEEENNNEEETVEPKEVETKEEVKEAEPIIIKIPEKPASSEPKEIEKSPDVYYDETIDEEIRGIIKKYYSKKNKKDKIFKTSVVILLVLILGVGVYISLKLMNII